MLLGAAGAPGRPAAAGRHVPGQAAHLALSLPDIGRRFGGRDHTTVIHAVRKIEELKASDLPIAEDVELLKRQLQG